MVKESEKERHGFCHHPAGTGKTIPVRSIGSESIEIKSVKRIILPDPVEVGESLGFLPGDLKEKTRSLFTTNVRMLRDMIPHEKLEGFIERKPCLKVASNSFYERENVR